jgi:hypothetical protein
VAADALPALLVGYDTAACGALASVNRSQGFLGLALVLCPEASGRSLWRVDWRLAPTGTSPAVAGPALETAALALAGNAMADALPLFQALARAHPGEVTLPLSASLQVEMRLQAVPAPITQPSAQA